MTNPTNDTAVLEGRLAALCERARRARMRKRESEYPPLEEVQPLLAALVAAYRAASDVDRDRMRSLWRGKLDAQAWLMWIAGEWARGQAASGGADDFENALAALSIEDGTLDIDQTELLLGVIWHRAHRAGIDLRGALERVAAYSGRSEAGFAALLHGWERSEFLKVAVTPHLDAECLPYEADD